MQVLDHGFVELVGKTGHVGLATVNAARCSFQNTDYGEDVFHDEDERLVRYLLQHGHTSPFRHAFFTFHIKAPLFVFRQWWKYQVGSTWREYEMSDSALSLGKFKPIQEGRIDAIDIQIDTDQGCSWNELSGRYKVMDPEFYWPEEARTNNGRQSSVPAPELTAEMRDRMDRCYTFCLANYHKMLEAGVAKELARLVLPPAIYSEAVWTVSLQAVLHFLDQRLAKDAQYEIRQYAKAVFELIKPSTADMGIRLDS